MRICCCVLLLLGLTAAQGPGNGVSKSTMTSSDPLTGLEFMLRHFPTTTAEDSCYGNYCSPYGSPDGEKWQGRAQLVQPFTGMVKRNCQLYSSYGSSTYAPGATNMVLPTTKGYDCSYYQGYSFNTQGATPMYAAFAHNADTCCKACSATKGCAAATYTPESSMQNQTLSASRRLLQPTPGEGFGLHLVDVLPSSTKGGIDVATLEGHFKTRLGDMNSYDAFMDYGVQLFTANLPYYYSALTAEKVPVLAASWPLPSDASTKWYSLFVHVPNSQLVLEIVGKENPLSGNPQPALTALETRMSARNVKLYSTYVKDENNLLYAANVQRATSDMDTIDNFYTSVIKATKVLSVDLAQYGIKRNCYAWSGAASDVCFTSRPTGSKGSFTVKEFESMLWTVHSTVLTAPSALPGDKYNDNHYAVDLQISGDYIASYFQAHNPFPLSKTSTFGFACDQSYIIDPTGWAIQTDLFFTTSYPGCGWSNSSKAIAVKKRLRASQ